MVSISDQIYERKCARSNEPNVCCILMVLRCMFFFRKCSIKNVGSVLFEALKCNKEVGTPYRNNFTRVGADMTLNINAMRRRMYPILQLKYRKRPYNSFAVPFDVVKIQIRIFIRILLEYDADPTLEKKIRSGSSKEMNGVLTCDLSAASWTCAWARMLLLMEVLGVDTAGLKPALCLIFIQRKCTQCIRNHTYFFSSEYQV